MQSSSLNLKSIQIGMTLYQNSESSQTQSDLIQNERPGRQQKRSGEFSEELRTAVRSKHISSGYNPLGQGLRVSPRDSVPNMSFLDAVKTLVGDTAEVNTDGKVRGVLPGADHYIDLGIYKLDDAHNLTARLYAGALSLLGRK